LKFFYNFLFVDNLSDNDGDVVMKIQGKVLLYTSRDSIEPMMAMRQDVTPVLSDVLLGLSGRYSPIRSGFLYFLAIVSF